MKKQKQKFTEEELKKLLEAETEKLLQEWDKDIQKLLKKDKVLYEDGALWMVQ